MDWQGFSSVSPARLYIIASTEAAIDDYRYSVHYRSVIDAAGAKILRGERCVNELRVFQEFAAALQFPSYFGENWDALEESLLDLDWLQAPAYVLFLTSVDAVFRDHDRGFRTLVSILSRVSRDWMEPTPPEVEPTRPRTPFHVVFQTTKEALTVSRSRLETVGARPVDARLEGSDRSA